MKTNETYQSKTRTFKLRDPDGEQTVHVTIAFDGNRAVGIDLKCGKLGEDVRGLYAIAAGLATLAFSRGATLREVAAVMRHTSFGLAGLTGDAAFPTAKSIPDYIAAWLESLEAAHETASR